jgi:hypothetical protein
MWPLASERPSLTLVFGTQPARQKMLGTFGIWHVPGLKSSCSPPATRRSRGRSRIRPPSPLKCSCAHSFFSDAAFAARLYGCTNCSGTEILVELPSVHSERPQVSLSATRHDGICPRHPA